MKFLVIAKIDGSDISQQNKPQLAKTAARLMNITGGTLSLYKDRLIIKCSSNPVVKASADYLHSIFACGKGIPNPVEVCNELNGDCDSEEEIRAVTHVIEDASIGAVILILVVDKTLADKLPDLFFGEQFGFPSSFMHDCSPGQAIAINCERPQMNLLG